MRRLCLAVFLVYTIGVSELTWVGARRAGMGSGLDEDSGAAVWDGVQWDDFDTVWHADESVSTNTSNVSVPLPGGANVTTGEPPALNSSGVFEYTADSSWEQDPLIDLSFQQQLSDINQQFNDLMDNLVGPRNNTGSQTWTFVSFVTLMPLRCSSVEKVAALFDQAMASANPGADIESVAQRFGGSPCSSNGVCPCVENDRRRYTSRVMELRTRSKHRRVMYPRVEEFPYGVEILPV